ncbi:MAG: helix-turn-helix transcriptional regulator [Actinomycetota bacterium]|nr:helix-turn-helix transcriptional regulator [Actinomycetota bacterium]
MGTHLEIMTLARTLVEVDHADYLTAFTAAVRRLLPGDDMLWLDTDFERQQFGVWRASDAGRDRHIEQVMPHLGGQPAIQSYVRRPDDLTPRRLSDVSDQIGPGARQARSLSQQAMGAHQLSLIVEVRPGGRGRGWVVIRERRDFSDRDVDVASALLPVLLVLDRYHRPDVVGSVVDDPGAQRSASTVTYGWATLTVRERQVVDLTVAGLTARAVGTALGISTRTVNKHLEHAYNKLGRHDRLAVARDLTERTVRAQLD